MVHRVDPRFSSGIFRFYFKSGLPGLALLSCMLVVEGCGSSSQSGPPNPAQVQVTVGGGGQVRLGSTAQFTATVTNTANTAVTWQVNGVTGGSSAWGTISAAGLYTPPARFRRPIR